MKTRRRCVWAEGDALMRAYHDEEWGVVERDSRRLWEALMLDAFQAGLAWITVLRKREAFRKAFAALTRRPWRGSARTYRRCSRTPASFARAPRSSRSSAMHRRISPWSARGEDFSRFVWGMAGGKTIRSSGEEVPATDGALEADSLALKERGFKFAGPVATYAWMQATGMVGTIMPGVLPALGCA